MVKLTSDELARIHALADEADEPVSRLVRRWIVQHYAATFGDTTPKAKKPQ